MTRTSLPFLTVALLALTCLAQEPFSFANSEVWSAQKASIEENPGMLYANKQYFDLRDALQKHPAKHSTEFLFYHGVVNNKFNQPRLSIEYLNNYLKRHNGESSNRLVETYETLGDDYRKTFQYRKAAEAYKVILTRFGADIDEHKKQDYQNEFKLWRALEFVPPQIAIFKGDSIISKDRYGHVPFKIDGYELALTFDTGANISVIRDSLARKFGLRTINAGVDVEGSSGIKAKANLAIARTIELGNVVLRNVVFLVFSDADLFVSDADLQLDGVIGLPVIAALREVTFERDGRLFIPAKSNGVGEQNMALEGFTPLIAGSFKGERFTFAFDTGANASTLYPAFFKRFRSDIEGTFTPHVERVRGVGGYREIKGYLAKNLLLTFSGKEVRYDKIPILTEHTNESSQHFYGNIGTDLVNRFEKMTMNFKTMSIVFK